MIVGLTGKNAAGKGVAAEYLKSRGFYYDSLSDVLRDEIGKRGEEVTREALIEMGRELRRRFGEGYLARQVAARLEEDKNYVVDSFRHPLEVEVFRNFPRFVLISVEASPETRFQRIRQRGRESDPLSFEEFQKLEEKEATSQKSEGQQLEASGKLADYHLKNNGSVEDFERSLAELLTQLMRQMQRPGWDEYFMRIAQVASLRSNCVKRKVAAIIVRDRRIISTGYNGTPRGTRNCYEGGCPRCNDLAESGTRLDECLCSHGEENAITQAAYHGVSVRGATLYTTFSPCLMCTKMIINAGIREVVYNLEYPLNETSMGLLNEAGVEVRQHRLGRVTSVK